jgi:hypothetical protein
LQSKASSTANVVRIVESHKGSKTLISIMGNSIRCPRRVTHDNFLNQSFASQHTTTNNQGIHDVFNDQDSWELITPSAEATAADTNNVTRSNLRARFRKAVFKIITAITVRYLWARVGHMLCENRRRRIHLTRRHALLSSIWHSLRPLTLKHTHLFTHLKRTRGTLQHR